MTLYGWTRTIHNACEPKNEIQFLAEREGDEYVPIALSSICCWRDGISAYSIVQTLTGFEWYNAGRTGMAATFGEAFSHLPMRLTHPAHFEDSAVYAIAPLVAARLQGGES